MFALAHSACASKVRQITYTPGLRLLHVWSAVTGGEGDLGERTAGVRKTRSEMGQLSSFNWDLCEVSGGGGGGGGWLFFWDKKMCLDYKVLYQHPFLKFCFILETWVLILLLPEVWTFRAKSLCNQATWFHLEQKDFSITFSGHKLVIILLGSTNIITFKVSIFPQSQFLCSLPGMSFSLMLFFSASSSLQERMWEASSSCSFHSFTPHPENRKGCRFSWAMPRCRRQNRLKKF